VLGKKAILVVKCSILFYLYNVDHPPQSINFTEFQQLTDSDLVSERGSFLRCRNDHVHDRIVQFLSREIQGTMSSGTSHQVAMFEPITLWMDVLQCITYIGECQNSHHSVWNVCTHQTYDSGHVQSRPKYVFIHSCGIGKTARSRLHSL
jgi:hypothetical protein